jgi:hypothetical protein
VEAPPELWEKVRAGRSVETSPEAAGRSARAPFRLSFAALAAAMALLVFVLLPPRELRSSDPGQVRSWVLAKAGIDIPLPSALSPSVRILTASRPDKSTAKIAYQVNGQDATLLVSLASAAGAGDGHHKTLARTANTWSWSMGGVLYTVSCPSAEISQVACQLCHSL